MSCKYTDLFNFNCLLDFFSFLSISPGYSKASQKIEQKANT